MAKYVVGYDLNNPGKTYDKIIGALQGYGTYWRHLDSFCIIETNQTHTQIRDYLKQFIDGNDELLVLPLTGGWATYGFSSEAIEWLNNHM